MRFVAACVQCLRPLVTWVSTLCAGPLGRGQQGWSEAEEEEEEGGWGDALTVRPHPNPITDCGHSTAAREGWNRGTMKEKDVGRHQSGQKTRRRREEEKEEERTVCKEGKRKDKH